MTYKQCLRASSAVIATMAMLQAPIAFADGVVVGPMSSRVVHDVVMSQVQDPPLTHDQKVALLRERVKYVFVLFQENRSFDQHLGTFPGAHGLFSQPTAQTPGFVSPIVNTDGSVGTISPFLVPQSVTVGGTTIPLYPEDTDSVDHSHTGINNSMHFDANKIAHNDLYALNEEGLTVKNGQIVPFKTGATLKPSLFQKQRGELVMGHLDCDTIPFLWQYADRFALFDNFFQTTVGPSTPNAIALIAGQSGETQWVLHPEQSSANTGSPVIAKSAGVPIVGDNGPFAGSNFDTSPVKPPYGLQDEPPSRPALNQTYVSLPLSFEGPQIYKTIAADQNPGLDLADVQNDLRAIHDTNQTVAWSWYQQGYDAEPTDSTAKPTGFNYIVHHNGPQYFGYVGDNTKMQKHLRGLGDFFSDMGATNLPKGGGVFYVRGGYGNNAGLTPRDPNPAVQANFTGNDDHPGYSDAQISEALVADEINAIAASPYWSQSAIIVTYDETDGLYDHMPPHVRAMDPEGNVLTGGPRIPAIVISPYARAHVISHDYGEHSSIIKFINTLFDLKPLAFMPDELHARGLGQAEFGQANLGPADAIVSMTDLLPAFHNGRLLKQVAPLPASYASIPPAIVHSLPHYGGNGCYALNIVPTDYRNGALVDPAPADFNPRPGTTPGIPGTAGFTP